MSTPLAVSAEKKSKKWRWIVGIALVLIVWSTIANLGESKPEALPQRPAATANAPQPEAPVVAESEAPAVQAGIGTPVRDGKFEFTVTDVVSGLSEVGDNPFLIEKAQGQFTIVTIAVLNTSDEPKGLSPDAQDMYDGEGRKFSADTSAAIGLESDVAFWDEINPGNSVTMKVVFDMPIDAVPAEIELHDSTFSGGVRVSLT
jgi:hypothetical protein